MKLPGKHEVLRHQSFQITLCDVAKGMWETIQFTFQGRFAEIDRAQVHHLIHIFPESEKILPWSRQIQISSNKTVAPTDEGEAILFHSQSGEIGPGVACSAMRVEDET